MRVWVLALALGGCGFSSSAASGNGSNGSGQDPGGVLPPDGSGGGTPDAGPVHICLGTFINVCADAPRGSLNLMTGTIDTSDTSASSKCLPASHYSLNPMIDACVIASQTIAIPSGNTVSVTGAKRLILLADEALTIAGTLDAASHRGGPAGPAADAGPCPSNVRNATTGGQGGGAWGGTFGAPGNNGGNAPGGGMGGGAGSLLQITTFGGGCPGGKGASNSIGQGGGSGGHGGGAVLLLAGQSVRVSGAVNASGAGGNGGRARGGGGGGGTGGMIVVEAPTVSVTGKCFANGGAGGEGSSVVDGGDGGESTAPDTAARGGTGISVGGDGGAGGIAKVGAKPGSDGGQTGPPLNDVGGGGAGGGGVGIIKIFSADTQNTDDPSKVSPAPT